MAETRAGGLKARATNLERYGADFYSKIGQKGWSKRPYGWFCQYDTRQRSEYGRKGGYISRRTGTKNGFGKKHIKENANA